MKKVANQTSARAPRNFRTKQNVKHCSQVRSQISTGTGQMLSSRVAAWRAMIVLQEAPLTVVSRPMALADALGQMVGVVRFELTTSTSRT